MLTWVLVAASCASPPPPRTTSPEKAEAPEVRPDGIEEKVLEAVNSVRNREGAGKLLWHTTVAAAAESHSRAMARRGFFSHTDPERGELAARMKEASVEWTLVAENLFQQRGCADPVACAVQGWLESPGHRRNLLNPKYTHTGIGVSSDGRGTVYYTQIFLVP